GRVYCTSPSTQLKLPEPDYSRRADTTLQWLLCASHFPPFLTRNFQECQYLLFPLSAHTFVSVRVASIACPGNSKKSRTPPTPASLPPYLRRNCRPLDCATAASGCYPLLAGQPGYSFFARCDCCPGSLLKRLFCAGGYHSGVSSQIFLVPAIG